MNFSNQTEANQIEVVCKVVLYGKLELNKYNVETPPMHSNFNILSSNFGIRNHGHFSLTTSDYAPLSSAMGLYFGRIMCLQGIDCAVLIILQQA